MNERTELIKTIVQAIDLRENILTGIAAELKVMLTEAQEKNEELVTTCEALVNHIVGMYASGGESLEVIIKAREVITRNKD